MSYETGVADARARKAAKYHDLVEAGIAAGYRAKLLNLVVGSRGMLGDADFHLLREATDAPRKECTSMCLHIIKAAILGSFSIWATVVMWLELCLGCTSYLIVVYVCSTIKSI